MCGINSLCIFVILDYLYVFVMLLVFFIVCVVVIYRIKNL